MRALQLLFLFIIARATYCSGQCPVPDFSLPTSGCLNQTYQINNLSGVGTYQWDFCAGDYENVPAAQEAFTLPLAFGRPDMDLAFDGTLWYGFATAYFSNTLYRLQFANGTNNTPTLIEDLGNVDGKLNTPGPVRVIQEGGQWFAMIQNTTPGELIKVSFGSQLSNTPTATVIATGISPSTDNIGMAFGRDAVDGWVGVFSSLSGSFIIIRLGFGLTSPGPSDIITSATGNSPTNIDLINVCGNWYGFAVANFGISDVYRLSFGANLFSSPVIATVIGLPSGIQCGRNRMVKDGESYYMLVPSLNYEPIFKLKFGADVTQNPVVVAETSLGSIPTNAYALAVAKDKSTWTVLVMSQSTGRTFNVNYPGNCLTTPPVSTQANPIINFNQAGTFMVSLEYSNSSGTSAKTKQIVVSSTAAPDIDFSTQNVCVTSSINFTPMNVSGDLLSYNWDFGDSGTSLSGVTSHTYSAAGLYHVSLSVSASSGCNNFIQKPFSVYNPPVADFSLPVSSPICTNQSYTFTNTSTFDPGSTPVWQWSLNGTSVSSQQNFTTQFSSASSQNVSLDASIEGCNSFKPVTISTVIAGPNVNFSANDDCVGNLVTFTNTTSGADAGVLWDFGDGSNSMQVSPSHVFSSSGTFQVVLTAMNSAGCHNFKGKPNTQYSKPQPDFAVGLPPFSCANSPTQFQNSTPPLSDSNIISWSWQFGDTGVSTQQVPTHTYLTAGNYNASLKAMSDKGCFNTIAKPIVISPSPTADFTVGPSCVNQVTKFTDLSSGAQSLLWQIGSTTSTSSGPTYTFTAPGDNSVVLNATGANGCINVKTKTIKVPVVPVQNFSATNSCAGQSTNFTDLTASPTDAVVGWNWNFAGNSDTGNPASFVFTPDGTYNVKMTTTHASGCKYTLSKNIVINPSPVAGFTAIPSSGSAPLVVQFINTSQQASQYAWKFFDKVTATSTAISPVYTFASIGNYSAELTATNAFGCFNKLSAPIQVLVPSLDLILKDFSLVNDPATGRLKGVVTILNNSNIPVNTSEVSLILSDKSVVNELLTLNLNPGQSIVKTLSFTVPQNQSDFICAEINIEKDVQSDNNKRCINLADSEYYFSPYPNPSSGVVHIDWISKGSGSGGIMVFDNMGRMVYNWNTSYKVGLTQTVLDLTFLTGGLYYIRIITSTSQRTMRFLRQ